MQKFATKMYRISKNQLAKKMILCAKMAFLKFTKMIGHVEIFYSTYVQSCVICTFSTIIMKSMKKKQTKQKLTMNFTIKKTQPSRNIMLPTTYIVWFFPLFYHYSYDQFNLITQTESNPRKLSYYILHGLIISGKTLRNRLFHAVICYYRIV